MARESSEQRSRRLRSERQRRYYEKTKVEGVSPAGTVRVILTLRVSQKMAEHIEAQGNKAGYVMKLIDADMATGYHGTRSDDAGLLPCPFCGSTVIRSEYWDSMDADSWRVDCADCGAEVNDWQCDQAAAEAAWNKRR